MITKSLLARSIRRCCSFTGIRNCIGSPKCKFLQQNRRLPRSLGLAHSSTCTQTRCAMTSEAAFRLTDVGANLTDSMFQGEYHGKKYHEADLDAVLKRAFAAGVQRIIITATNLSEARAALKLARTDGERQPVQLASSSASISTYRMAACLATLSVKTTLKCTEFEEHPDGAEAYMAALLDLALEGKQQNKVVAVGEMGLDYDRLQFCSAETQQKWFARQFDLARDSGLPLFLHMRAAAPDMLQMLQGKRSYFTKGVIHSFDGSIDEAQQILAMEGLSIGINGCSLKTEDNLEVVRQLPLDRVLLETDSPWCEPRPTHASRQHVKTIAAAVDKKKYQADKLVKGRNEPGSGMQQVLEIVSSVMDKNPAAVAEQTWRNSTQMFFPWQD